MGRAPRAGRVRDRVLGRAGRADVSIHYTAEVKAGACSPLAAGWTRQRWRSRFVAEPPRGYKRLRALLFNEAGSAARSPPSPGRIAGELHVSRGLHADVPD